MNRFGTFLLLPVVAVLMAGSADAQTAKVDVQNAWSRATPPSANTGAVYLTMVSPTGDTLTGASSPAASTVQVHEMSMDGSVMRMRELPAGLALPPGQPVTLQPGGYHIMLVGLKAPLKQGDTVRVHLTFAKAAPMDVSAQVAGLGAASAPGGPAAATMPGMKTH